MQTLKFKAQLTDAFFAIVNQIFGGSWPSLQAPGTPFLQPEEGEGIKGCLRFVMLVDMLCQIISSINTTKRELYLILIILFWYAWAEYQTSMVELSF